LFQLEIFKRGNPNPFDEPLALTRLLISSAKEQDINELMKPFRAGKDACTLLHNQLSPYFSKVGLRLKVFTTPMEVLNELKRLEPPDNPLTNVFWNQVTEILKIF